MKPGRSPFAKTGHGIPTPFMQTKINIGTGEDLSAQAKAKAEADAKAKQLAAGENKGDSKNIRNFEGTATVEKEGQKVERFAKTPAEIKKWKAASAENKAKYEKRSATETVKLSDTGVDKPTPITPTAAEPKSYGSWYKTGTAGNNTGFGGGSESGWTNDNSFVSSSQQKDYIDKYEGKNVITNNMASSSQNSFNVKPVTAEENRISNAYGSNSVSPYDDAWSDYGPMRGKDRPNRTMDTSPGSGEKRRQEYIKSTITKLDQKDADKKAIQERLAAKKAETLKGIAERKALAEKAKQERLAARNSQKGTATDKPVAMQLKKKAKAPIKMKKY